MSLISLNLLNRCWDTELHHRQDLQPPHCQDPQVTYPEGGSNNSKYMSQSPLECPPSSTCSSTQQVLVWVTMPGVQAAAVPSNTSNTPPLGSQHMPCVGERHRGCSLCLVTQVTGVFAGYGYRRWVCSDPPCRSSRELAVPSVFHLCLRGSIRPSARTVCLLHSLTKQQCWLVPLRNPCLTPVWTPRSAAGFSKPCPWIWNTLSKLPLAPLLW